MESNIALPVNAGDMNIPNEDDIHPTAVTPFTATTLSGGASESESASDSGSDSEDEAQQHLQIKNLESKLSSNPSDYDAHVEYIKVLRKMGEIEKLKQARESMSQIFPLSPSMWQEWLKDEISLSSGPEAVPAIEELFERAVSDYLSVPLWCEYLNFIQENVPSVRECSSAGLSKARALFERAIPAAGLHFSEGSKIWCAYREFEQAVFLTMVDSDTELRFAPLMCSHPQGCKANSYSKLKEKQIQRIRNIFHRQLKVPLADMSSNLQTYKAWLVEQGDVLDVNSDDLSGVPSHIASEYKKALSLHDARVTMEERISGADLNEPERLSAFMNYIKFEDSSGDPARSLVLYERAVAEFPVSNDLWLEYTRYLDKTLKDVNVARDVYVRATKNCPWVGELWSRYLLSLERCHSSKDELSAVFERALQCTFASYEEYLDLFLTRIDGLRRKMSSDEEIQVFDYAVIRDTFQRASDYLSPQLKGTEALLHLYSYWARLELSLRKDITAARSVWESLLKISGSMLEAWKAYVAMEIENGNIHEARSIYRRCYTKRFPGSGSEDVCHSWLRFEREFGTLEDYDQAMLKVSRRLEELQLYKLQQESKTIAASTEHKDNVSKKNVREKRKSGASLPDQSPAKRQKGLGVSKEELKVDSGRGREPTERNMGEEEPKAELDGVNEHQKKETRRDKSKFTDQCTAFISNLNFQTNVEQLGNFFGDVGGVVAVRILKDKFSGKSRGLAYVDFSDEARLNAALAKNKGTLMGKKLSIRKSDPTKSKREASGKDGKKESSDEQGGNTDKSEGSRASKHEAPAFVGRRRGSESIQLEGRNTFAVPRSVRPLQKKVDTTSKPAEDDETPKSNDEFRELLLKK